MGNLGAKDESIKSTESFAVLLFLFLVNGRLNDFKNIGGRRDVPLGRILGNAVYDLRGMPIIADSVCNLLLPLLPKWAIYVRIFLWKTPFSFFDRFIDEINSFTRIEFFVLVISVAPFSSGRSIHSIERLSKQLEGEVIPCSILALHFAYDRSSFVKLF